MDNIKHLISAYFYELWDQHEYSSWQDAVDDFVRRSPDRAESVPQEIAALLAENQNDEELADQLDRWGFDAQTSDGEREWLLRVRDRVASDLAAASA
jgi:hypothetical protein